MPGQKFWTTKLFQHTKGSADVHEDEALSTPPVPTSRHVDRIILGIAHTGASTDDVTTFRIYTMIDDVSASSLARGFPDDGDVNVWFRQIIFGSTPIYVSWRPKRTIRQGEVLFLDTDNRKFSAAHEVEGYVQILQHEL